MTPLKSPSTRARWTESIGIAPISEPKGRYTADEADDGGMANSRAISLEADIAAAAAKRYGRELIFF